MKRASVVILFCGAVAALVSVIQAPSVVDAAAKTSRIKRWPGGCRLREASLANPPAEDQVGWSASVRNLVGDPRAFWLIPGGCAWLYYPTATEAQKAAPSPGASSVPELRYKIRGRVHRTEMPVLASALGLEGQPTWDFQTFTVAWPYAHFAACNYEGITEQGGSAAHARYGHFTSYTYDARGVGLARPAECDQVGEPLARRPSRPAVSV